MEEVIIFDQERLKPGPAHGNTLGIRVAVRLDAAF